MSSSANSTEQRIWLISVVNRGIGLVNNILTLPNIVKGRSDLALLLRVTERCCSSEESVDPYTMHLWSQIDPIVVTQCYILVQLKRTYKFLKRYDATILLAIANKATRESQEREKR
ncbi:hypothetical protein PROFUN_16246 [Planoprotostelium fungivorum]|uniref:Uncharacterized protein n=1 Tax=Planoprotostelium fungivorum TaxID=1890364 RepID=A0A2P6MRC3_9EUKA|nr:hypothetical protein PROFUN_16246 [Planoprotostelium fungivorum]